MSVINPTPDFPYFQSIPESYLTVSPSLEILNVTNHFCQTVKISRDKLIGKSFWDVFVCPENGATYLSILLNKKSSIFYVRPIGSTEQTLFTLSTHSVLNDSNELSIIFCKIVNAVELKEHFSKKNQTDLLHKINDSFPGIVALYNCINGDYLYINQSVEKILGYTSEELIQGGVTFIASLIHPDDVIELMDKNNSIIHLANSLYPNFDDSQVLSFEYRLRSKDGSYKWVHTYGIIFERSWDYKVEYILNVSIDITERKERELSIKTSESKLMLVQSILEEKIKHGREELTNKETYYSFMAEAIPGILWTAKPDGANDYYSKRLVDYTGMSIEEALKGAWTKLIHPEDQEATFSAVTNSINYGTNYEVEHRIKGKDGIYRWFISRAIPLKNEKGTIIKWFGTSLNIDEEKRALMLLQEKETKYNFLADSIPQIIWTSDISGNINYFNKKWYEYTGLPANSLDPKAMVQCVHPDDLERITSSFLNAISTGEPFSYEVRLRKQSGEYRWFQANGVPMKNNDETIIKWFGSSTDIHDQKEIIENLAKTQKGLNQINQELNNKNEELQKINIDLDNFIYTASHDLKAPILNIEGLITFLKKTDSYSAQEVKQILDLMEESTKRFKKTISGLTDVVKIQKSEIDDVDEICFEEVLNEILPDIVEVKSSGATILTDFKEQPSINFSRRNLRSVLYNLTSNAIKYRSPLRTPQLEITSKSDSLHTVLMVKDNGLGLPKDNKDNVFKMFKRLHTHTEGTGIGLYIVKRIMDNAGGKIEIESELNKGTKFLLYFKNNSVK